MLTPYEKAVHYLTWTSFSVKEIAEKTGLHRREIYKINHELKGARK